MTSREHFTPAEHTIKPIGLHTKLYERPNSNGPGRQVIKESCPSSDLNLPFLFPDQSRIAIRNEYHAIQYIRQHTSIPVPNIIEFHDNPNLPVQIIMEFVENALPPKYLRVPNEARHRVQAQFDGYLSQLHSISDPECRSFAGIPLFGVRFEETKIPIQDFHYKRYDIDSPYVLCHGDLAWHNLLLDPVTYEIVCVLDWEYAGFYPVQVEGEYWRRSGPLGSIRPEEECDIDEVMRVLWSHRVMETVEHPVEEEEIVYRGAGSRDLLRDAHLGLDLTPSMGTILCEGASTSRTRIVQGIDDLSRHLETDCGNTARILSKVDKYKSGLLVNKLDVMSHDGRPLRSLSNQLPNAFSTLSTSLKASPSPYSSLQRHFSAEADIAVQLRQQEQLQSLPGTEGWILETLLRQKARELSGEGRNLADQIFREVESQKWTAIEEFAISLLQMSAAAKSVMPYLSDYDREYPSANIDKDRAWTEYRALDIGVKNGTGGWDVKVVDIEDSVVSLKEQFEANWIETKEERERFVGTKLAQSRRARDKIQREVQKRAVEREKTRGV